MGPYGRQCAPSANFYPMAQTSSYATGHNRTNNGFFKLVETLLQVYSCFFSHSINVRGLPLSAVDSLLHWLTRSLRWTPGSNEDRARRAQFPGRLITMGELNHCGERRMTSGVTEKSQQWHKHILQYSAFASERPQVRTWGRQTCFLPRAPSNLVTSLVQQSHTSKTPATVNTKCTFEDLWPCYCYA